MLWTVLGWLVWISAGFIALHLWEIKFKHPDGGLRILAGRQAFLVSISLIFTVTTGYHKLHLLWVCPLIIKGTRLVTFAIWKCKMKRFISRVRVEHERTGQSIDDVLRQEVARLELQSTNNTISAERNMEARCELQSRGQASSDALQQEAASGTSFLAKTITLSEADHIIDVYLEALQVDDGLPFHPISRLQGFNTFQVIAAIKLWLANVFLALEESEMPSERFEEEVVSCKSLPWYSHLFIPDAEFEKLRQLPKGSSDYYDVFMRLKPLTAAEQFLDLETIASFADYCKFVGANDPLFWEKIYDRIGLPHPDATSNDQRQHWQCRGECLVGEWHGDTFPTRV